MPPKYAVRPKFNFLEMAHTNFVSSVWTTPDQPLILTKNDNNQIYLRNFKNFDVFQMFPYIYFQTSSYIQKSTLDLIKTFWTTIYDTKHPNTFPTFIFFQKSKKSWAPRASSDSAWATKLICLRNNNLPDATTLTLHALS